MLGKHATSDYSAIMRSPGTCCTCPIFSLNLTSCNFVYHFLPQFLVLTYILVVVWLAVFAFSAIPVFFFFNMAQTCHNINLLAETAPSINQHSWICMDARQYGESDASWPSSFFLPTDRLMSRS